jgi:phage-related protein
LSNRVNQIKSAVDAARANAANAGLDRLSASLKAAQDAIKAGQATQQALSEKASADITKAVRGAQTAAAALDDKARNALQQSLSQAGDNLASGAASITKAIADLQAKASEVAAAAAGLAGQAVTAIGSGISAIGGAIATGAGAGAGAGAGGAAGASFAIGG